VPELNISTASMVGAAKPRRASGLNDQRLSPLSTDHCHDLLGMNDHGYGPTEVLVRDTKASTAIIEAFKNAGARVVQGSPGCVGLVPRWSKFTNSTTSDLNLNLCQLRNMGIDIAQAEKVGFADVFWPMLKADHFAREKYGADYAVPGKDGVHPGWAGHVVMAYAFLKAFGLDGAIGTFTVDPARSKAEVSRGHEVISFADGELQIRSIRYPFAWGLETRVRMTTFVLDDAGALPPDLNRLMPVVKNPRAKNYQLTWGTETKSYSADQLGKGINLAEEFVVNPFSDAFAKVDKAIAAKQAYETKQIKVHFMDLQVSRTWKPPCWKLKVNDCRLSPQSDRRSFQSHTQSESRVNNSAAQEK
jgi:hypothetical protein